MSQVSAAVGGATGYATQNGGTTSGAGVITFPPVSLSKITFAVTGSTGAPKVAEFETYAG